MPRGLPRGYLRATGFETRGQGALDATIGLGEVPRMPTATLRASKLSQGKRRSSGKRNGPVAVGKPGKSVQFRHPAAFGEAARKYAGIVSSGIGNLSTREGFGD